MVVCDNTMNELRAAAEKMREEGYSYALIHEKLGISKSTMSYWFKDRPFQPNQYVLSRIQKGPGKVGIRRHNERTREIHELKQQGINEIGELSERDLWMLGLGLYIGEGSKTIEQIRIVNSDASVIYVCVRWLKEVCGLSSDNITITLHLYPDNDPEKCISYWQKITGLPRKNFRKTQIDKRQGKHKYRKNRLPFGTAHLRVISNGDSEKGVRLYRRVAGWVAGAVNRV
jgi:hypothetical protein